MTALCADKTAGDPGFQVLWQDAERIFCRGSREALDCATVPVLAVLPPDGDHWLDSLSRLAHEYGLKDTLDETWALRPLEFARDRQVLFLEHREGGLLASLIGSPMEVGGFLRLAIALTEALGQMHRSGLIHKDIKPGNVFVNDGTGEVWLTGFGTASRVPRQRQSPAPLEVISGTFAYMAPEQTGRMNRSIDIRSDLYSLGVTFYEMLAGVLPFTASDPMEWIHCHVARQPPAPAERVIGIPEPISAIVMRLLAKGAEDRYQTATSLKCDLMHCLTEWQACERIAPFSLGDHDTSTELSFQEKLYGREVETHHLMAALDLVVSLGASQLVLVSGYSGIGKSSVVNELHRALVPARGLFATGKFDQYKRGIPYATLAQAFQSLVQQLLSKSDTELDRWRNALTQALGPHGQLMINLIPALALIIGEQPPVSELSGPEAQGRFLLALRQFLGVFAREEHPLVLVLDDLQWLDSATLDVFEHLATQPEVRHLLLVGVYRDNEVGPAHPLTRRLEMIRTSGTLMREIVLGAVTIQDIARMIADALGAQPQQVAALADIVYEKTAGNPFFTIQFVSALADEALLTCDAQTSRWRWHIDGIRARRVGDNVVDLMIDRLSRLPERSLQALKQLACLGNSVEIARFHQINETPSADVQTLLHEALRTGLLLQVDDAYAFAHDRVHEAAYAMLPELERATIHRRVGSRLLAGLAEPQVDAQIFEIASQFNRARTALTDTAERANSASLNLRAGRRAKASAAYPAACGYFAEGRAHLGPQGWSAQIELAFALTLEHAECAFLSGERDEAERIASSALDYATTNVDRGRVYRLWIELHVVRSQNDAAIASGLTGLHLFGIELQAHPTREQVQREYETIWQNLDGRPLDCLGELPAMTDPERQAAMRLLAELIAPAYFTDFNLMALVICQMVNLSLVHGGTEASNQGYAWLGWLLGPAFARYDEGYRIGQLACEVIARRNVLLDTARVNHTMGLTSSWTQPLSTSIHWFRIAYRMGVEAGDLYFACYSSAHIAVSLLLRGHNLQQDAEECREYLSFARGIGFRDGADLIVTAERTIASLRGLTRDLADFGDERFDAAELEADLTRSGMNIVVYWYWTRKIMLHVLAGDYQAALLASERARPEPWIKVVQIQHLDYHYYTALAIAAHIEQAPLEERQALRERLSAHHEQLRAWTEETGSPTFPDKHVLISAEIARLEGREHDAARLYDESIRLAHQNGFLQSEGVANEVAGRFYEGRGLGRIARMYLGDARHCYLRWGADGKVQQLDQNYPQAREERATSGSMSTSTTSAPMELLDLATVVKVSQAVSGEIVFGKMIDTLMRTAIEHAGAERAVLMLARGAELRIEAEATTKGDTVRVHLRDASVAAAAMPETIVQYVTRTAETVMLDDASTDNAFFTDPYLRQRRTRSLLCLPLLHQAKRVGVLYLENNLAAHVFTAKRISILKLLASQAAVSLENSRLYNDLEAREAKIRRLVDANVIGIVTWNLDGQVLDANDAFLSMVQYERKDLEANLRWVDMTPPDWRASDAIVIAELVRTGAMQPYEKEFFRKDGSRVPILMGAVTFDGRSDEGLAFILDLTERKQAEEKARDSERRYRDLQAELAHANRVATMGQLSAWIAHDVRQPLAGVVSSGNAGLRWLQAEPPNVAAAQRAFERIVRDGHRAAEVLERIRALVKKASPQKEAVDVNEVIAETIALIGPEAQRKGILIQTDLAGVIPLVSADRIQVQQVVVNLIVNAIEAMNADTTAHGHALLVVSEVDPASSVRVAVHDTGPGVPEESREHLFDAFYTTKSEGMGMGLAICRTIIESFGGRIWATPNTPRGAVFQFVLPGPVEAPLSSI